MKVAVTGHRLQRIKGKNQSIQKWLIQTISGIKSQYKGAELITGMARGVDQMAALAAIKCDVPVLCYFPYRHSLSDAEQYIVDKAAGVQFLEDEYSGGCFTRRDCRMVDDCDVLLAVWDGVKNGGTYYTYRYALEKGVQIIRYPWRIIGYDLVHEAGLMNS